MENLKALTSQFFERHWPKDEESKIPEWSEPWSFKSSVPNNEQGVDSDGIRQYESTKEGVDAIMTIGFPVKYGYLAAALELYLIQNIKPERNTIYKYSS